MDLFDAACDLPVPSRDALVADTAAADPVLAADLLALLGHDAAPPTALDRLPGSPGAVRAAAEALDPRLVSYVDDGAPLPEAIGPYRILRRIGQGGMGTVLEAEQASPRRRVALKVLRPELTTERTRRRFRAEAEILARLAHPGIARVYEASVDGPQPYLVMELVDGVPLNVWATARGASLDERLRLLAAICDAVEHAHLNGVVHRDLKPANILVEDDGTPRVLDFGIARVVDPEATPNIAGATLTGELLGTPAYMSPEQTRPTAEGVDHRADVYTLGVLAYELLTDTLPYDLDGLDLFLALERVRAISPRPPSARRDGLHRDLDVIVLKALAKEPAARYASAAALADDLRRFLAHEPIRARPPTVRYKLGRFVRRNRAVVAALAALFVALVTGVVVASGLYLEGERARAELAARVDELVLLQARATLPDDPTRAVRMLEELSGAAPWDRAAALAWDAAGRGVASHLLDGHTAAIEWADFAADGARLATASYDGTVRLWSLADGTSRVLAGHRGEVNRVAFAPDGHALASAGRDGAVRIWSPDGAPRRELIGHTDEVEDLAWDPAGRRLVSAGADGVVRLWDTDTGAGRALAERGPPAQEVVWSADGRFVAAALRSGAVGLWRVDGGAAPRRLQGHATDVEHVAFSPAAPLLASGDEGGELRMWALDGVGADRVLAGHRAPIKGLTFAGADRLASVDRDGELRLWDLARGEATVLARGGAVFRAVASSRGGPWLATAADDGVATLWDLAAAAPEPHPLLGHVAALSHVAFAPDGRRLVTVDDAGQARVWPTPGERTRWSGGAAGARLIAASPTARRLVVGGEDGDVGLVDIGDGETRRGETRWLTGRGEELAAVAWALDGRRVAVARRDGEVSWWGVGAVGAALEGRVDAGSRPQRVAWSRDGRGIAVATSGGAVATWTLEEGAASAPRVLGGHDDRALDVVFVADPGGASGRGELVSAGRDGRVLVGAVEPRRELARFDGAVTRLVASPDGRWLAAAARSGEVGRWRVGAEGLVAVGGARHTSAVLAVALRDDGLIASADGGGVLWLSPAEPGARRRALSGHEGAVFTLAFDGGGGHLVSGGADRTARVWALGVGAGPVASVVDARVVDGFDGPVRDVAVVFGRGAGRFAVLADAATVTVWPLGLPGDEETGRAWVREATSP